MSDPVPKPMCGLQKLYITLKRTHDCLRSSISLEKFWVILFNLAMQFLMVRFMRSTADVFKSPSGTVPETTLYSTFSSLFPLLVLTTYP